MKIDTLDAVQLGDSTQWIRVRGADASNPVLLLIQQGPGLPMINEIRRFEKLLGLEKDFTVVYWDQRGCGRSLRGHKGEAAPTLDLMVNDAVSLLELLRDRFDTRKRGVIPRSLFRRPWPQPRVAETSEPDPPHPFSAQSDQRRHQRQGSYPANDRVLPPLIWSHTPPNLGHD
jgi:hypothetical protein